MITYKNNQKSDNMAPISQRNIIIGEKLPKVHSPKIHKQKEAVEDLCRFAISKCFAG
jgi:hypothetical protein